MPSTPVNVHPAKTCLACKGAMNPVFEDVTYEIDGLRIVVEGVPMSVCEGCQERYIPGPVAERISQLVADTVGEIQAREASHPVAHARTVVFEADRDIAMQLAYA
jgi:YgiT-type zinc finger domain-containing protein